MHAPPTTISVSGARTRTCHTPRINCVVQHSLSCADAGSKAHHAADAELAHLPSSRTLRATARDTWCSSGSALEQGTCPALSCMSPHLLSCAAPVRSEPLLVRRPARPVLARLHITGARHMAGQQVPASPVSPCVLNYARLTADTRTDTHAQRGRATSRSDGPLRRRQLRQAYTEHPRTRYARRVWMRVGGEGDGEGRQWRLATCIGGRLSNASLGASGHGKIEGGGSGSSDIVVEGRQCAARPLTRVERTVR